MIKSFEMVKVEVDPASLKMAFHCPSNVIELKQNYALTHRHKVPKATTAWLHRAIQGYHRCKSIVISQKRVYAKGVAFEAGRGVWWEFRPG